MERDFHAVKVKAEGEAKINLGSETVRPTLVQVWNMSDKDTIRALQLVITHQAELLAKWREIHGEPKSD